MTTHPASFQLDALALGCPDAVAKTTQTHVQSCGKCTQYVESLHAELAGAEPLPPLRVPSADPARVFTLRRAAFTATPLLAAAAGLLFYLRAAPPAAPDVATEPSAHVVEAHFKGGLPMAVVLERDGVQSRHTDRIVVRPGDRLRIEIAVDVARPTTAGILDASGDFVTALAPTLLEPGTHYSDLSIRIDAHPSAGWVLAGPPAAVERARETKDFAEVSAIPMAVEAP